MINCDAGLCHFFLYPSAFHEGALDYVLGVDYEGFRSVGASASNSKSNLVTRLELLRRDSYFLDVGVGVWCWCFVISLDPESGFAEGLLVPHVERCGL